jgi:hypothetical protein
MDTILDLDLDFFNWPPFRHEHELPRLPASECKHLASSFQVRDFLERQCCLSEQFPLRGHEAEFHKDAIKVWRCWIDEGLLSVPFNIVHIDAHSDLGQGEDSLYIERELLALPVIQRRCLNDGADCHLDSGNYLLFAIANNWVDNLTCVYPVEPVFPIQDTSGKHVAPEQELRSFGSHCDKILYGEELLPCDIPAWIFRESDRRTGIIELKQYRLNQSPLCHDPTLNTEPPVSFKNQASNDFHLSGFTHFFLARSPQHTPKKADRLLPLIRKYFRQV